MKVANCLKKPPKRHSIYTHIFSPVFSRTCKDFVGHHSQRVNNETTQQQSQYWHREEEEEESTPANNQVAKSGQNFENRAPHHLQPKSRTVGVVEPRIKQEAKKDPVEKKFEFSYTKKLPRHFKEALRRKRRRSESSSSSSSSEFESATSDTSTTSSWSSSSRREARIWTGKRRKVGNGSRNPSRESRGSVASADKNGLASNFENRKHKMEGLRYLNIL